ncbi:MAG: ABC transporter, partial [Acidobacteriota bacterium]|nr:ABC transporter [Acidobacteriota bacterium]
PGGHVQLEFATPQALELAVGVVANAARDEDGEKLLLRVPHDGRVASLRTLLTELDHADVEIEQLSIHSPDLDDVFFAVTGHPTDTEAVR